IGLSDFAQPAKLAPDAQRTQLAQLQGRWTDSDHHSLVIDADGSARVSWLAPNDLRATFEYAGLMPLTSGEKFVDQLSFALEDEKTLSLCINSLYQHGARAGDDQSFSGRVFGDALSFDHGRCTVVTAYGELVTASCALEPRGQYQLMRFS